MKSLVTRKLENIRRNCRKRGLEKTKLIAYDVQKLLSNPICHYCGVFCEVGLPDRTPNLFTFERVDPKQGYTPENVVCACWQCNNGKAKEDQKVVPWRDRPNQRRKVYLSENEKKRRTRSGYFVSSF